MSHISDLTLTHMTLRFREPVRYAGTWRTTQQVAILHLIADDGTVGHGEVAGPTQPADIDSFVEQTRRVLLGTDPATSACCPARSGQDWRPRCSTSGDGSRVGRWPSCWADDRGVLPSTACSC